MLMGGFFGTPKPEYNIRRDRLAAQIVFSSGVPITAVGLDVTMKCKLEGADLDRLRAAENPASRFLMRLIGLWQAENSQKYPTLHDPLAVATSFLPGVIETQSGRVEVHLFRPLDGVTVFTPSEKLPPGTAPTALVAQFVNVRRLLDLFVERLSAPPRGK